MTVQFRCVDGPHDGRTFTYPDPAPEVVVFGDAQLHYHEYRLQRGPRRKVHASTRGMPVYCWERSYRIPAQPEQDDDEPCGDVLAW